MPKKRVFAVDIGTQRVKVVEIAWARSGVQVTRVGVAERTSDDVASAVRRAMSDARIRGGECVVGIPRSKVVLRRLTRLPRGLDDEALRGVVELQAESALPFNPGEAVFDFFNVQQIENEGVSVEVVAAQIDEVEAYLHPVREAGGQPIAIVPSTFGLAALAIRHAEQTNTTERLLLLNVGYETTDACFVAGERLLFSRTVPCGLVHFEREPNEGIRRFFSELERTLRSFRRDAGEEAELPFDAIWLWGGGADLAFERDEAESVPLSQLIEEELGSPVRPASPIAGVERAGAIEKSSLGWAPLGTALGYALVGLDEAWPVNLLPSAERQRKKQTERTRRLLVYGATAALLFAGLFLLGNRVRHYQAEKVRALDAEIARYRSGRAAAMKQLTQLEAMSSLLEPRFSQLDILREVTALLPDRRPIAATSYTVEPSGKITIHFEAQSNDAISEAVTRIGRSAWFTNVRPGQISTVQKENKPIRTFVLTMQLAEDADVLAAKRVGATLEKPPQEEAIAEAPKASVSNEGEANRASLGGSKTQEGSRRATGPRGGVSARPDGGSPPPPTVTSATRVVSDEGTVTVIEPRSEVATSDETNDEAADNADDEAVDNADDNADEVTPAPRARPVRIGSALSDR